MRTLSVFGALACVLALTVATGVAGASVSVGDADDAALMEIGVDLSSALNPTPTYVTTPPAGHDLPTMAKFPLMHEIQGVEAKDWQDIQGLLFREPVVASESSLDMKLDELEAKFNKIDTMPVPSPIAPPGSTLLPKKVEIELGLRATLDKPRMVQKPTAKAAAAAPKAAAAAPKAAAAKSIAAAPVAKAAVVQPKAAAAKPAAAPAAAPAKPTPATVNEAVSTVKLIEKRIRGLSILFQRLKANIGIAAAGPKAAAAAPRVGSAAPKAAAAGKADPSAAKRVQAALNKHRKDAADLKKRMAAKKKTRFVQLGMDLDADLDADAEADAQESFEAEQELMAEGSSFAELDAEAEAETEVEADAEMEAEVESEAEAEAELNLDAEAVDQILETLM